MQKDNKIFEDMARLASDAAGGLLDMKREVEAMVGRQLEKLLKKMNLATREEVDTLHGMIAKAREEQEEMRKRLLEIETRIKS